MINDSISTQFRRVGAVLMLVFGLCATPATAQSVDVRQTTYSRPYDIFVGGTYFRGDLGPNRNDSNLGGWNVGATRFFTPRLGFAVDVQGNYGQAPLFGSPATNASVYHYVFLAGPQIRVRMKEKFSASLRLLAGAADSDADTARFGGSPQIFGLYPNATTLAFKPGGAFDYNLSPRVALRVSSGVLLERENGTFQKRLDTSAGVVFRFGRRM